MVSVSFLSPRCLYALPGLGSSARYERAMLSWPEHVPNQTIERRSKPSCGQREISNEPASNMQVWGVFIPTKVRAVSLYRFFICFAAWTSSIVFSRRKRKDHTCLKLSSCIHDRHTTDSSNLTQIPFAKAFGVREALSPSLPRFRGLRNGFARFQADEKTPFCGQTGPFAVREGRNNIYLTTPGSYIVALDNNWNVLWCHPSLMHCSSKTTKSKRQIILTRSASNTTSHDPSVTYTTNNKLPEKSLEMLPAWLSRAPELGRRLKALHVSLPGLVLVCWAVDGRPDWDTLEQTSASEPWNPDSLTALAQPRDWSTLRQGAHGLREIL